MPQWCASRHDRFEIARWDGDDAVIVFQTLSGDLHLISENGAGILQILQEKPCSRVDILKRMLPNMDAAEANSAWADIERLYLRPFLKLGLIEIYST